MTQELHDRRTNALARYRENVTSGTTFMLASNSFRSADHMNYSPPISAREYGAALKVLGSFAANTGDWGSAVVTAVLPALSTSQGRFAIAAGLYERASTFVREGWYDFQSATGPEAGRPSSHQHPTTEKQALSVALLMAELTAALGADIPRLGWCLAELIQEHAIPVYSHVFPRIDTRDWKNDQWTERDAQ